MMQQGSGLVRGLFPAIGWGILLGICFSVWLNYSVVSLFFLIFMTDHDVALQEFLYSSQLTVAQRLPNFMAWRMHYGLCSPLLIYLLQTLNLHIREIFHPDFDLHGLPAHVYLRSVHNISIEHSWL
jgi:hypothetical protein